MLIAPSGRRVLWLLSSFGALIAAHDAKTVAFPVAGNESAAELRNKMESMIRPDTIRPVEPPPRPVALSSNYFFHAPQRTFPHPRSEGFPYAYEYPNFGYPMAHAMDHSMISPSSKHLVVVSFIGLLLLFAIIQNTITAVKRREALIEVLSSRQKRDVYSTRDFNTVTAEQEDVLNDDGRVRCIQKTVCLENRKLIEELGILGKILAKYLTRDVEKSLEPTSGWARLVEDAGAAGIRGEDCEVLYRDCDESLSKEYRRQTSRKKRENENSNFPLYPRLSYN